MIRAILVVILAGFLVACGATVAAPSNQVISQALSLHLTQVQQELNQHLPIGSDQPPQFEIKHLAIAQKNPVSIEKLPGYQIQGTYDLTLKFPKRQVTQKQNPFELYLQWQKDSESWRWARQTGTPETGDVWVTQLLQ
ncbi:MAG: hypothetical protein VKJ46_14310 [Leptolyngbyaceae bacterium]|nr:hypothetical protein [Leptolyngbyaceae bacterium]